MIRCVRPEQSSSGVKKRILAARGSRSTQGKNVDCREQRDIMQRAPVPSDKTVLRKAGINSRVIRRELPSGLHLTLAWCQEGLL